MWKQFKVYDIRTKTEGTCMFCKDDYIVLFDDGEILYREDILIPLSKLLSMSISGLEPVLEDDEAIETLLFLKDKKWI